MIRIGKESTKMRARNYEINESAGDLIITKAVVLANDYNPRHTVDFLKVLSFNIHAIYNSYVWNVPTRSLSKGVLKSHSDIIHDNHINEDKVIGYFVKEGNKVLEYELMYREASKYLSDEQIRKIEDELKKLKW